MNILTFSGHLGRDPETRYSQAGEAITTLAVPCTQGFGDKKKTTWVQCLLFKKRAEAAAEHLRKGQLVFVSGAFFLEEYTNREGVKATVAKVFVSDITWAKSDAPPVQPPAPNQPARPAPTQQQRPAATKSNDQQRQESQAARDFGDDLTDDDIPF